MIIRQIDSTVLYQIKATHESKRIIKREWDGKNTN